MWVDFGALLDRVGLHIMPHRALKITMRGADNGRHDKKGISCMDRRVTALLRWEGAHGGSTEAERCTYMYDGCQIMDTVLAFQKK